MGGSPPNPRTIREKTPWGVILGAIGAGVLVLGLIVLATWQAGSQLESARMRGVITKKEFVPAPEQQITIGDSGVTTRRSAGEFILTVEVRRPNEPPKEYRVWLDQKRYDAVKVGDPFDVGPYLVR